MAVRPVVVRRVRRALQLPVVPQGQVVLLVPDPELQQAALPPLVRPLRPEARLPASPR